MSGQEGECRHLLATSQVAQEVPRLAELAATRAARAATRAAQTAERAVVAQRAMQAKQMSEVDRAVLAQRAMQAADWAKQAVVAADWAEQAVATADWAERAWTVSEATEMARAVVEAMDRAEKAEAEAVEMTRAAWGLLNVAEAQSPSQSVTKPTNPLAPPQLAEYLLWYLPKESRENIIGDLEGEFRIAVDRFGRRKAIAWYYYQVGASFWPVMARKAEKLLKWGVLGWIGDLIHRVIT